MKKLFCGRRSTSSSDEDADQECVNFQHVLTEEEKARKQLEKKIFDAIEKKECIAKIKELIGQQSIDICKLRNEEQGKKGVLHFLAETKYSRDEETKLKEIFQFFIEKGCSVNDYDENENTPVKLAAEIGNIPVIELLVENKADLNISDKLSGDTPLHWAAKRGMLETVHILIKSGATVTIQNKCQKTPLHYAVEAGHKSIVLLLLYHKAVPGIKDEKNETPLGCAEKGNSPEIVALLKEPNEKFENEQKLLEYAKEGHQYPDIVNLFEKPEKMDGHGEHVISDSTSTGVTNYLQPVFNITLQDNSQAAIGVDPKLNIHHSKSAWQSSANSSSSPVWPQCRTRGLPSRKFQELISRDISLCLSRNVIFFAQ